MIVSSLLLALMSLAAPGPNPQELTQEPLEGTAPKQTTLPNEVVVIPLDLSRGWPVIEVRLGGEGPYRMILDTGSSVTVLHSSVQEKLGLESTRTQRIGDPSNPTAIEMDVINIPELSIGDAYFTDFTALAWTDDMGLSSIGIYGIVGLPLFEDCLLTLDYGAKEARIYAGALPAADGKRIVQFEGKDNITLPLEINGEIVDAHFDSGNSRRVVLPGRLEHTVALVPGTEHTGSATRASGTVEVRGGKFDGKITIGAVVLDHPEVVFDDSLPVANVGRTFLEAGPVTIDMKNRRVRLGAEVSQPAAANVVRRDMSKGRRPLGIEMGMRGSTDLRISRVVPGSLAEKSGLLAGDVLLTVNGKPVTAMDHEPLKDALSGSAGFPIQVERGGKKLVIEIPAA